MDLRILFATFSAVFLAELADKTQLVGLNMSAKTGKPWMVFVASVAAYAVITAITVLIGAKLSEALKPEYIRYVGGGLFVLLGVLMLANKL